MMKKIRNNKLITIIVLTSGALGILLLGSCSNQRVRDRFDEDVLNRSEDHYNLFLQDTIFPTAKQIPSNPAEPKISEANTEFYRVSLLKGLEPVRLQTLENMENYSSVSICWNDGPPVLRFWQRLFNKNSMEFTCPVDKSNSRRIGEKNGAVEYELIVSLRQGTMFPWIQMDDYEIFKLKLTNYRDSGKWEINGFTMLTDNRIEDIQPIFSPDYSKIAFVQLDDEQPSLWMMNADGSGQEKISDSASMPYFIPDTGAIIFVRRSDEGMDFFVYDLKSRQTRLAKSREIEAAFRFIPYARLKENYLMIDGFRRDRDIPARSLTYKTALFYGLRNGPEVLRDYYDYQSSLAGATQYLYDIGPDLFGTSNYSAANNFLVQDKDTSPVGDSISQQDFLRLIGGLSVPVIPNIPLRKATYAQERWNAEASRCQLHKTINNYMRDMATVFLDYAEHQDCLAEYQKMCMVGQQRVKEFNFQEQNELNTRERVFFARTSLDGMTSDRANEAEALIASQLKLSAMLGLNTDRELQLQMMPVDRMLPAFNDEIPSLEWFQAIGQLNNPDIQRVNFLILVASAVRDMGPVSTRTNGVSVSASYGIGISKWSEATDDFLLLGASYIQPLRLPKVYDSYYDSWGSKVNSLRQEKYRVQGTVKYDIHEAFKNLETQRNALKTLNGRVSLMAERMRISGIYKDLGRMNFQMEQLKAQLSGYDDSFGNLLSYYEDKVKLIRAKYEFLRCLAKLYAVSGASSRLAPQLARYADPQKPAVTAPVRGVYLWKSLEVVTSKEKRNEFIELCRSRNINKVYCFVDMTKDKQPFLSKYNLEFAYFTMLCSRYNIKVYALMGEPDWITPEYRTIINTLLESYSKFNRAAELNGGVPFSGLKLDVEPHALPQWNKDSQALSKQYLTLLRQVSAAVGKDQLSVDASYNYNGLMLDKEHDLLYYIAAEVERITVMAYLDRTEKIVEKMRPILGRSDLKCNLEAALETAPVKEKYISFYGKPYGILESVCRDLNKTFADFDRFRGIIFNDYENYKLMK